MAEQTVTREAPRRAASRIGMLSGGTSAGHVLDRLLYEVDAEAAARRAEVDAEVRERWQACSEGIEGEVSDYAVDSYHSWIEDADGDDDDDQDQTPERRRRARYGTLGEWADAEDEGAGDDRTYAADIAEYAGEMAERFLTRDDDAEDLREALERSISGREWVWRGIRTAYVEELMDGADWIAFADRWRPTSQPTEKDAVESARVGRAIRAEPMRCWFNARWAIRRLGDYAEATYVEGWAAVEDRFPIEHGWIVRDGTIIDPTLPERRIAYFPGMELRGRREIDEFLATPHGRRCRWQPFTRAFYEVKDNPSCRALEAAVAYIQGRAASTSPTGSRK